jgi:hypothetical protein
LHDRFDDYQDEDERGDGLQSIERLTWLRWIFFILGSLGPGIKLIAMEGVPCTKVFGVIFLLSFVVIEALVVFSILNRNYITISLSGRVTWPGYSRATLNHKFGPLRTGLKACTMAFAGLALFLQVALMHWAYLPLWVNHLRGSSLYSTIELVLISSATIAGLVFGLYYLFRTHPFFSAFHGGFLWLTTKLHTYWFLSIKGGVAPAIRPHPIDGDFGRSLISFFFQAFVITAVVAALGHLFPQIGTEILVMAVERRSHPAHLPEPVTQISRKRLDYGACLSLTLFVLSLTICVFWYSSEYAPDNTINPMWTGVFG